MPIKKQKKCRAIIAVTLFSILLLWISSVTLVMAFYSNRTQIFLGRGFLEIYVSIDPEHDFVAKDRWRNRDIILEMSGYEAATWAQSPPTTQSCGMTSRTINARPPHFQFTPPTWEYVQTNAFWNCRSWGFKGPALGKVKPQHYPINAAGEWSFTGPRPMIYRCEIPLGWTSVIALHVATLLWRKARTTLPGHCWNCGYNLTRNTSGVCPECGEGMVGRVIT